MAKQQKFDDDPYINALMQGNIYGNKNIRAEVTFAINDRLRVQNENIRASAKDKMATATVMVEQRLARKRGRK
jgi:hypothetical protein